MKASTIFGTLLFILLTFISSSLAAQLDNSLTENQAREEAQIAIDYIRKSHPNQYWANSKAIWDQYEKKLLDRKGKVSISQHYFDLAHLFSLANDTHTQIYPDKESPGFKSVYPIRFRTFADGLYVISADSNYEDYIGKKVVSIGGKSVSEIMDTLSEHVSSDNVERKKTLAEFLLVMPETYVVFNLAKNNKVELLLEDIEGNRSTGYLDKTDPKSFATVFYEDPESFGILVPDHWKTVYDKLQVEAPFTRENPRKKYWHKTLTAKSGKLVEYIQINKNDNEEIGETQFDFILRVFQEIRQKGDDVERIVIDLRYNLGGWIKNTAALSGLLYGSDFYKHGKTVVLIGRETVSAGAILAADIESKNYAYFIGEPTGSKPNMFLDHKHVDMPYSKFYAESATDLYVVTNERDKRKYLAPDFPISESFADFISGKDVFLTKAMEVTTEEIKAAFKGYYRSDMWNRPSQKTASKKPGSVE